MILRTIRTGMCLLIYSFCVKHLSWSQIPQPPHTVVGRVQIPAVTQPLKLAEENRISLQSSGLGATSVIASWAYYNSSGFIEREMNDRPDILAVNSDSTGNAFINITPRKLGRVRVMLSVSFADGGVEHKKIDFQVVPSELPPEKLVITYGGGDNRRDTPVLSLDLSDEAKKLGVFASAVYKSLMYPVSLNASDVSFKMLSSTGSEAAAEIDPSTGIVTARHVGQTLLETTFQGVSTLTCIDVMKNASVGPRSRCEELLPPGRSLPPGLTVTDSPPIVQVPSQRTRTP